MKDFTNARLLVLALASLIAWPLHAQESVYFDIKAAPESVMADYVDVEGGEKLVGVKKILVPQFRVEFMLRAESAASDGAYLGGGSHVSGSASVYVHLKGVDDAVLQKITDQAYADFVKEMTARGIEVIGPDKLASDGLYEPILRIGKPSGERLETKDSLSAFFAPTGARVYTLLRRTDKDRQGIGSSFSTAWDDTQKEIPKAELMLAKKYNAPSMKVLLTVTPARVKTSAAAAGGVVGAVASLMTSEEIKPGLTVTEESRLVFRSAEHSENDFKMFGGKSYFGSKVRDFTEEGDSAVYLKHDVRVSDPISVTGMVETTDDLNKVGNALAPVMALTLGHSGTHKEFTVEADPVMFEKVATEEISATNRMLAARFLKASNSVIPTVEPKSEASDNPASE